MFQPFELNIGLRYTRARARNHFISFISASSMLGVMLGVIALIVVLSVMNGFHKEVRERILGMASHASVRAADGGMKDWQKAMNWAKQHPEVVGTAPFVEGQAMLVNRGNVGAAMVRGILPEHEPSVSDVGEHMLAGKLELLEAGSFNIILGKELAAILGASVGQKVTVVVPQANITPVGTMPRLKRFNVVGIFEVGMGEYDRGIALVHMKDAAKLQRLGETVTGVRLQLEDMFEARRVAREMLNQVKDGYYHIVDWTQEHRNFFSALETEKRMMGLILLLIVAVAAFNIVSTLVMVVTDKQSDIAILKTLGATSKSIMKIFIIQGAILGFVGTVLGVIGGVLLAQNLESIVASIESLFDVQFIDPNIYYISRLPSDLHWDDVWLISGAAFVISLLATLYPAWMASRTQPAEALRYE